jgi:hypothetical protein
MAVEVPCFTVVISWLSMLACWCNSMKHIYVVVVLCVGLTPSWFSCSFNSVPSFCKGASVGRRSSAFLVALVVVLCYCCDQCCQMLLVLSLCDLE